jgi:phage-related minor tail protein
LLSVVVGFSLFVAALQLIPSLAEQTGADSEPINYVLLHVTWTVLVALVCGFLTAWIAGTHEFPHVATLGFLMVGLSAYSMKDQAVFRPGWYQIAVAGCGPISAMVGAGVRVFVRLRQPAKAAAENVNTSGEASRR